jgi:hypothetical protein
VRKTDRGAHDRPVRAQHVGLRDPLDQGVADGLHLLRRRPARVDHREDVAAQPGDRLHARRLDAAGELLEQHVAGFAPEPVVDEVEPVEIERQDEQPGRAPTLAVERFVDGPDQLGPSQRAGQMVVRAEIGEFFVALAPLAVVPERQLHDAAGQPAVLAHLGKVRDVDENAAILRIADQRGRQRARHRDPAFRKGLLHRREHRARQHVPRLAADDAAAVRPEQQRRRHPAGSENDAILADHQSTVEIVLEDARQCVARSIGLADEKAPGLADRLGDPLAVTASGAPPPLTGCQDRHGRDAVAIRSERRSTGSGGSR